MYFYSLINSTIFDCFIINTMRIVKNYKMLEENKNMKSIEKLAYKKNIENFGKML